MTMAPLTLQISMTTAPPTTDDSLLARGLAGDRGALAEIYIRHLDAAVAVANRIMHGDHQSAEDAVHNAFVALMQRRPARSGTASPRSWLLGAVANHCRTIVRERSARHRRERLAPPPPRHELPEVNEEAAIALTAAQALEETYRLPVLLRCVDGLDFADIAEIMSRPEKTVRSQVDRGLERLRELLQKRGIVAAPIALLALLPRPAASATLAESIVRASTVSLWTAQRAAFAATAAIAVVTIGATVVSLIDRPAQKHVADQALQAAAPVDAVSALLRQNSWVQPFAHQTFASYAVNVARADGVVMRMHRAVYDDVRVLGESAARPARMREWNDFGTLSALAESCGYALAIADDIVWIGPAGIEHDVRWTEADAALIRSRQELASDLAVPIESAMLPQGGERLSDWLRRLVATLPADHLHIEVAPELGDMPLTAVTGAVVASAGIAARDINQTIVIPPGRADDSLANRPDSLLWLLTHIASQLDADVSPSAQVITLRPHGEPAPPAVPSSIQ
jgi:RNA polymerase sigma-70 factor, ECF subfamily